MDSRRDQHIIDVGPLASTLQARLAQLEAMQIPRRLWAHDPSLWAEDDAGQNEVRRCMGWIEAPDRSRALVPGLDRFAHDMRSGGITHALLLGIGGSELPAEVVSRVFAPRESGETTPLALHVLDSVDPEQVRSALRTAPPEQTLYLIASKSGGTSEVNALLDIFWARARNKLGERAAGHFVAITDPGSRLEILARERKFSRVFLSDPTTGGRFSALTPFGLLPAALMQVNAAKLLERARWMAEQCSSSVPVADNPAMLLAAALAEAALRGRDKLTLLIDPPIEAFGAWVEALVAQSSGKQGKGIVPVDGEPWVELAKYGSDRLFVYIKLDGALEERAAALRNAGLPVLVLPLQDAYDLGAQFFLWQMAIVAGCSILAINAFDHPELSEQKESAKVRVEAFRETGSLHESQPVWEGAGGRVYGWNFPGLNGSKTLADAVRAYIEQAREGDYVALQAFMPHNPRSLLRLQELRARILKACGRATTLGFGPRFLHATGQLHKGGANNGLFLQITRSPRSDLEIPGQDMTFASLELALALADLELLLARGRRAIRIHLEDGDIKDLLM